jgi:hypothetical protein
MRSRNLSCRRSSPSVATGALVLILAAWAMPCQAQRLSTQETWLVNNTAEDIYVYYHFLNQRGWGGPLFIRARGAIQVVGSTSQLFVVSRAGARTNLGVVNIGAVQRLDRYAVLVIEPEISTASNPSTVIRHRLRVFSRGFYWHYHNFLRHR